MLLFVLGHTNLYECENLCRLFFPLDRVQSRKAVEEVPDGVRAVWTVLEGGVYTVRVRDAAGETSDSGADTGEEYDVTALLFRVLRRHTGVQPPWGMLTGIHPVKLLRQLTEKYGGGAGEVFREKYFVTGEKAAFAARVLREQEKITSGLSKNDFALYIGIPFCPTRCAYCSFVSQAVEKAAKQIPQFVELLLRELGETGRIARELGLRLTSVYVGGGTPTTLSAPQLSALLETVHRSFDLSACTEFTVEAGRPDTVDAEKLAALRLGGVTRISVNPQTLEDSVLERIGRRHTAAQTVEAFCLARKMGFSDINMDLIVGLPGDTAAGFSRTLDGVLALGPECVTVHSLALKRSSDITQSGEVNEAHRNAALAEAMMREAGERLTAAGYAPYYLYRQTRMAGNLENVGWAKPGFASAYNVVTMDETETVLACGGGGVTKLCDAASGDVQRIFNFKFSYEYISRFAEVLERKKGIGAWYEQLRERIH